jgi:PAS domain S-box-containing protein
VSDLDPGSPEAARRDMAHALAVIVYSALPDLTLDFANDYALEYFGLTTDQVAGEHWLELVHPDDRDSVLASWNASLSTAKPYRHEHRLRLADGSYRRFLAQALPLRDDTGTVAKWYGVLTPLDLIPRISRPRTRPGKCIYPLRDLAGELHLVEVALWDSRPDDPAAQLHPSGAWVRIDPVEGL